MQLNPTLWGYLVVFFKIWVKSLMKTTKKTLEYPFKCTYICYYTDIQYFNKSFNNPLRILSVRVMSKEEIYEHLAQVYLGKKTKDSYRKKNKFDIPVFAKTILTLLIFSVSFYSLTAFLSKRHEGLKSNIIFALNNSPIRIKYNLNEPYPQVKDFSISIPPTDIGKYKTLNFSIRGLEEGYPDVVKVVLKNKRNETAFTLVSGVKLKWNRYSVPLDDFQNITDWMSLDKVSFVLEGWNVAKKKGIILIDDVCFSK